MLRSAYGKGWCCHALNMTTPYKRSVKLCLLLLMSVHLQAFLPGESQVVSLSFKDAPIQKVFAEIRKQTGYSFAYSETDIPKAKRVNINITNARILDALAIIFADQPFTYTIIERVISIKLKPEKKINQEQSSLLALEAIDVRGRVINEEGEPVAGVTVIVKGTKVGTSTNGEGEFTLNKVDPNAILILTAVNIQPIEASVNGRRNLDIRVKGKTGKLDEVQVIAYGTTSQRFSTGNVSTVKAADIEKQPVNNPLLALQGRVPGLFITQTTGVPGAGLIVRIQGQNSLTNGNDPLYVIDGVPISAQIPGSLGANILGKSGGIASGSEGRGNPLSYINPADIESIDVLKDADATAIYGSRAANGAILITTKKGKAGQTTIDVNLQHGWSSVTRKMEMLNTRQYLDVRREAFENDGRAAAPNRDFDLMLWDTTRYTDWQETLIGNTAQYTNINASVSGGTSYIQYLVGATFHKETNVFPGEFANKYGSVHFDISASSSNQKFRIQFKGNYMANDNRLPANDLTQKAILLEPNAPPLYLDDGSLNWAPNASGVSTFDNPLAPLFVKYNNKTKNLVSNMVLSYKVLPNLEIRSSFGYSNMQSDEFQGNNVLQAVRPERRSTTTRTAFYGTRSMTSWIIEPQLNYKIDIAKGKLDALIGITTQQNNTKGTYLSGSGYNSDYVMEDILSAASISGASGPMNTEYKYNAVFGRLNYNWKNKYILNLSARRDGSSRFGPENRFHNFGSIAAAWIFTEEELMKKMRFLSFGKIRSSYGTTGNDQIGDYNFLNLYYPAPVDVAYQNIPGLTTYGLPNPYLEWEETRKWQLGLDLGFFHDRVLLNLTYSLNRSSNQLLSYNLPSITGFGSIVDNFPATVQNTSLEISFNTVNVKGKNLNWSSGINLTIPANKLIAFPDLANTSYASQFIIGKPISIIKAYDFLGVDPLTGHYLYNDKSGNPISAPDFLSDQTVLLTSYPRFYGGFQNSVSYYGLQIDFLFQFVKQIGNNYSFYNGRVFPGQFSRGFSNQPTTVLNRWQKIGDNAAVAKYSTTNGYFDASSSDLFYRDASFVRLKNLSISWQLPSKWKQLLQLKNGRIFMQAQNLLTITNYKGMDPENQGLTSLPPLRVITFGIHVGF